MARQKSQTRGKARVPTEALSSSRSSMLLYESTGSGWADELSMIDLSIVRRGLPCCQTMLMQSAKQGQMVGKAMPSVSQPSERSRWSISATEPADSSAPQ